MIHIASKIGSEKVENQSLMHFCIFGRRFSLILFTACFFWWAWVITNSFLRTVRHLAAFARSFWESSFLNLWLAENVGWKFVACWKCGLLKGCWCKVTITISLFKRQVYIKTFDFPKLSKVSFIASIKSNIKAWLFCISNAV